MKIIKGILVNFRDFFLCKCYIISKLSIQVGLEFWDACYDKLGKPDYLGKFEFDRLYKISKERLRSTKQIEWEIDKVTHNKSLERNI